MFRKHQGSELNQHIRVIQRPVPGRQHFSHNPIHLSGSISPPVGPPPTEWFGTLPAASSFSGWGSFLIEHWPEFLTKLRLNLSAVLPFFAPPHLFLSPEYQSWTHTSSISFSISNQNRPEHIQEIFLWALSTWDQKIGQDIFFSFLVLA